MHHLDDKWCVMVTSFHHQVTPLFQWLSRRGPLQPLEFRRLGWSSLRPEPLSSPPFVLKTSLQNNDFKPMHSQKVFVLHFHMFFTFPNGCHFRFSTQTSNELPSRSACYSDDTQGNPLFYKLRASKLQLEDMLLSRPAVSCLQTHSAKIQWYFKFHKVLIFL